jgi:hypothetical protein
LEKDEILILGHDAGVEFARSCPNLTVGAPFHTQIADMLRFVTFGFEPTSKRGRQIRINEKFHRSEAAKTG